MAESFEITHVVIVSNVSITLESAANRWFVDTQPHLRRRDFKEAAIRETSARSVGEIRHASPFYLRSFCILNARNILIVIKWLTAGMIQLFFRCHWLIPSYQCKHRQGARLKTLYLHSISFPSRQHNICQLSTGFQHLSLAIIKYFNSSQLTSSESLPIRSKLWQSQPRQHCRLTICIELVELTNSIRWQDPNNNTDTETRCLVYPRQNNFWRTSRQERRQRRRQPLFCPSRWHHPICDGVWIIPDIFQIQWKLWWPCHYLCISLDVNPFPWCIVVFDTLVF